MPYESTLDSAYGTALINKNFSEALGMPSIVPVFPGTDDINARNANFFHAINEDALLFNRADLKRVDLQLLAMVDDAKAKLMAENIQMNNQIVINGFSDSGNYANRFTGLHPDRVKVMISGGINVFFFPVQEVNGVSFNYPLGVSDYSKYSPVEIGRAHV